MVYAEIPMNRPAGPEGHGVHLPDTGRLGLSDSGMQCKSPTSRRPKQELVCTPTSGRYTSDPLPRKELLQEGQRQAGQHVSTLGFGGSAFWTQLFEKEAMQSSMTLTLGQRRAAYQQENP